jgi:trigger factor
MKIDVQDIDSCNKKIQLEIPFGEYKGRVESQLKRLAGSIEMPGFRKGKVPRNLVDKQFGPEVKREVLTKLISDSVTEALEERGLRAVSPPSLVDVKAEENTDISVSASVEVIPEITIRDYSGIEVDMKVCRITDKEVEDVITYYRTRKAQIKLAEARPARNEDILKIDFNSTADGKEFDGSAITDYRLVLGGGSTVAGFDEHILGMSAGEEKDFKLTFPENYPQKEIAGKTADFHVKVKEIYERALPELNDDFAKKADPKKNYASVEDMRCKVREELEEYEKRQARKAAKNLLADKLGELHPIDVPESLVKEQIRFMTKRAKDPAAPDEAQHEHHDHEHDHEGKCVDVISPEDEKNHRPSAVKILQQELVVGKLTEDLGVDVTNEEMRQEIDEYVKMTGGDPAAMKRQWEKEGLLDQLQSRMRRDKTLEVLLQKVKIREEMVDRSAKPDDN